MNLAPERLAAELIAATGSERRALLGRASASPEVVIALKSEVKSSVGRDAREALRIARIAMQVARKSRDPRALAVACHAEGNALHALQRYREALSSYQQAGEGYRRTSDEGGELLVSRASVDALFRIGRHAEAESLARRTYQRMRKRGDRPGASGLLLNLANVLHSADRHTEAVVLLEKARRGLEAAGEHLSVANADLSRAICYSMMCRFDRSGPLFDSVRAAYQTLDRVSHAAVVDYNQAYDFFLQGRFHDARHLLARARAGFRRDGARHGLALASLDEAEMALAVNLPARAWEAATEARAAFAQSGASIEGARATLFLAEATRRLGDEPRAGELLAEARLAYTRHRHKGGLAAVDLALAAGGSLAPSRRLARALAAARGFASGGMRGREAMARVLAGTIAIEQGNTVSAHRWLTLARHSARRNRLGEVKIRAEHGLARLEEGAGRPGRALSHYRSAVRAYEGLRAGFGSDEDRVAFATDKAQVFEDAVRVALDLGRLDDAFAFIERVRSRSLLDLLGSDPRFDAATARRGGKLGRHLAKLKTRLLSIQARARDHERRASGSAAELAREMRNAVAAHDVALDRLAERAPDLAFALTGHPVAGIERIRALLGQERALVSWFREEQGLSALVITDQDVQARRQVASAAEINRSLGALRFALGAARLDPRRTESHREALLGTALAALEALHRQLIAPIEASLGERALVLVPSAALHGVPFHALSRGGRTVLESREVTVAPSATVLALAHRRRPRTSARVVMSSADTAAPLIADEGRSVARILDGELYEGSAATSERLRAEAGRARILHLAAHGIFEPMEPLLSGLELADGRLTLPEIAGLAMDASLVVLSACESAIGSARGDEVQGLVRSFLHAGTRSVVASLWSVHDASTADVMGGFHAGVARGDSVAAAYRVAALEARRERPHPFYWAPFQVVGSWDGVYSKNADKPSEGDAS